MRKALLIFLCFFVLSAPAFARQTEANFETTACPFTLPDGETEGTTIDCGMLTVPEDHNHPDGNQIQLAVAHIYSNSNALHSDPVIYLSGGPGGSALFEADDWAASPLRDERDIILLDQRGTGYSQPALNCDDANTTQGIQACHDQLVSKGIDLSLYNSAQSAADVADLRGALGITEWNLFGVSYGTRLALAIMRDNPEGVRSVILDSVYPPQVNDWEETSQDQLAAFTTLFNGCAADAACKSAYPDLEAAFYATVTQLNNQPAPYTTADGGDATMSGDELSEALFQALYVSDNIPLLPKILSEVSQGDYSSLGALKADDLSSLMTRQDEPTDDAEGTYTSVTCAEEVPFVNQETALANAAQTRPELQNGSVESVQFMFDTCKIWGVTPADPIEAEAVTSDIPTLLLSGEYDPVTPVAWAQDAAKTLSNSFIFEFPGTGHSVNDNGDCPKSIVSAFLDDPTSEPDPSCIATMGEPKFVTN